MIECFSILISSEMKNFLLKNHVVYTIGELFIQLNSASLPTATSEYCGYICVSVLLERTIIESRCHVVNIEVFHIYLHRQTSGWILGLSVCVVRY